MVFFNNVPEDFSKIDLDDIGSQVKDGGWDGVGGHWGEMGWTQLTLPH
jgi:hypothetical protein